MSSFFWRCGSDPTAASISASVLMLKSMHEPRATGNGELPERAGLFLVQPTKQIRPPALQRLPHAVEVFDGHVLSSRFDLLEITAINIRQFADLFLCQFTLVA